MQPAVSGLQPFDGLVVMASGAVLPRLGVITEASGIAWRNRLAEQLKPRRRCNEPASRRATFQLPHTAARGRALIHDLAPLPRRSRQLDAKAARRTVLFNTRQQSWRTDTSSQGSESVEWKSASSTRSSELDTIRAQGRRP
jgi:hypothetical protein